MRRSIHFAIGLGFSAAAISSQLAFVQTAEEPSRLSGVFSARPIEGYRADESTSTGQHSQAVHREVGTAGGSASLLSRSRWEVQPASYQTESRSATDSKGLSWRRSSVPEVNLAAPVLNRQPSQTQMARQISPIDPFNDPFGDRVSNQSSITKQSTVATQVPATLEPPRVSSPARVAQAARRQTISYPASTHPASQSDRKQVDLGENIARTSIYEIPFNVEKLIEGDGGYDSQLPKRSLTPKFHLYKLHLILEQEELIAERQAQLKTAPLDEQADLKQDIQDAKEEVQSLQFGADEGRESVYKRMRAQMHTWEYVEQGSLEVKIVDATLYSLINERLYLATGERDLLVVRLSQLTNNDDIEFACNEWGIPNDIHMVSPERGWVDSHTIPRVNFDDAGSPAEPWMSQTVTWTASALVHKPLYFEEIQLERYGHTAGPVLQPVLSGAHFFTSIVVLPYKIGMNPPNECRYALGFYRPGDCAPWLVDPLPISLRGALFQTGAMLGAAAVLP